jgi:hypothetical protein
MPEVGAAGGLRDHDGAGGRDDRGVVGGEPLEVREDLFDGHLKDLGQLRAVLDDRCVFDRTPVQERYSERSVGSL